jgi:hypothetical protein
LLARRHSALSTSSALSLRSTKSAIVRSRSLVVRYKLYLPTIRGASFLWFFNLPTAATRIGCRGR